MLPQLLADLTTPPRAQDVAEAPAPLRHRSWMLHPTFGVGRTASSPQRKLYELEGYGLGPDLVFAVGAGAFVSRRLALGGFLAYEPTKVSTPGSLGRSLTRESKIAAATVSYRMGNLRDFEALASARAGVLSGSASFDGHARRQTAPYGALAIDILVGRTLSLGVWASWAPAPRPGKEGASDDYGSAGLQIGAVLGD